MAVAAYLRESRVLSADSANTKRVAFLFSTVRAMRHCVLLQHMGGQSGLLQQGSRARKSSYAHQTPVCLNVEAFYNYGSGMLGPSARAVVAYTIYM